MSTPINTNWGKENVQVGDLVYYISRNGHKKYCIVTKISRPREIYSIHEHDFIYGTWKSSEQTAKEAESIDDGFMQRKEVFLVHRPVNWEAEL